jgi:hypothetical protein
MTAIGKINSVKTLATSHSELVLGTQRYSVLDSSHGEYQPEREV